MAKQHSLQEIMKERGAELSERLQDALRREQQLQQRVVESSSREGELNRRLSELSGQLSVLEANRKRFEEADDRNRASLLASEADAREMRKRAQEMEDRAEQLAEESEQLREELERERSAREDEVKKLQARVLECQAGGLHETEQAVLAERERGQEQVRQSQRELEHLMQHIRDKFSGFRLPYGVDADSSPAEMRQSLMDLLGQLPGVRQWFIDAVRTTTPGPGGPGGRREGGRLCVSIGGMGGAVCR